MSINIRTECKLCHKIVGKKKFYKTFHGLQLVICLDCHKKMEKAIKANLSVVRLTDKIKIKIYHPPKAEGRTCTSYGLVDTARRLLS